MWHAIRSYLTRRASVRAEAARLIELHGPAAHDVARSAAMSAMDDREARDRAWQVEYVVSRRVRAPGRGGAAGRYGDEARRRGDHPWLW